MVALRGSAACRRRSSLLIAGRAGVSGQLQYSSGQEVVPDFAGWEANPDGSFNMVFGYMNRNYEEHLHVPIGAEQQVRAGRDRSRSADVFLPAAEPARLPCQGSGRFRQQGARVDADLQREDPERLRDAQAGLWVGWPRHLSQQQRLLDGRAEP